MQEKDVARVHAIGTTAFKRTPGDMLEQKDLKAQVSAPKTKIIVAKDGDKIIGYCIIDMAYKGELGHAHITNIAVDPSSQRHGVGTALIKQTITDAAKQNCNYLTLYVRSSNEPAKGLYYKMGFGEAGRIKDYYSLPKEDALYLGQSLAAANKKGA
jgi:ribosomal-protein-alanine N-acetyltransferase